MNAFWLLFTLLLWNVIFEVNGRRSRGGGRNQKPAEKPAGTMNTRNTDPPASMTAKIEDGNCPQVSGADLLYSGVQMFTNPNLSVKGSAILKEYKLPDMYCNITCVLADTLRGDRTRYQIDRFAEDRSSVTIKATMYDDFVNFRVMLYGVCEILESE